MHPKLSIEIGLRCRLAHVASVLLLLLLLSVALLLLSATPLLLSALVFLR